LKDGAFDVVQINGLVNPHAAFAAAAERRAVVWQLLDTYSPPLVRRAMMMLVRRLANALMSTGKRVAAVHPGALAFGDRLISFFPPVDTGVFCAKPEVRRDARHELLFSENDFVVGTVGNVNMQKGHDVFVRAAATLKQQWPAARFIILGATYPHFQSYAEKLLEDAVSLGLRVPQDLRIIDPRERVAELAQAFDVFWLTSRPNSEGIPTAMEEAMSLGIPVVSFDVGAVAEAVDDGVSGFVVPGGDMGALVAATLSLARDLTMHSRISQQAARTAAQRFSHIACADAHMTAYLKAIRHAQRGDKCKSSV
jgi:glycosyltransferase involved in cell wall biosynthesis